MLFEEGVVGAEKARLDRHPGETPVQPEMTRLLRIGSVFFFADFCAGRKRQSAEVFLWDLEN
jgi:hypothetical protein